MSNWRVRILVRPKCRECHRYATMELVKDDGDQFPQGPFCALHGKAWMRRLNPPALLTEAKA